MDELALENSEGRVVISPRAGASLRSLRVRAPSGEFELIVGGDGPHDHASLPHGTGSFIMAPWPNRIRDGRLPASDGEHSLPVNSGVHAIHGLVREREWSVLERDETAATLAVDLESPWPYRGRVVYLVSLDGAALVQTMSIEAADGERPFPAGFGWHPWFRRSLGQGQMRLTAGVADQWQMDETITPTGAVITPPLLDEMRAGAVFPPGAMDGCFRLGDGGRVTLEWPEVTLEMFSSPELAHIQTYTPRPPLDHAICVEPQTCAVNAFQLAQQGFRGTGAATVAPGNPLRATTRWAWR